jgi:hypothetical protein
VALTGGFHATFWVLAAFALIAAPTVLAIIGPGTSYGGA